MNIPSLENITKILKKASSGTGSPNPQRDWIYLISAGCIALIISVLLSYVWSRTVDEAPAAETTTSPSEAKMAPLETVQEIFSTRASTREKYESTLHFVDPSQ